jgi:hypothetical protein
MDKLKLGGNYRKTFFGINLLTLACKLDLFIAMQRILLRFKNGLAYKEE